MEIKKLNETAVAIFTKSEEETDKLIKKLRVQLTEVENEN